MKLLSVTALVDLAHGFITVVAGTTFSLEEGEARGLGSKVTINGPGDTGTVLGGAGGGGGGSSTFAGLSDKTTADIPAVNTPVNTALAGKVATSTLGANNGVATLDSGGKVPTSQLPATVLGSLNYQGTWNATTNSPSLASGVGTKGLYYKVGTAGSTTIDGVSSWTVGDWIVYDGTTWDKVDGNPTEVLSVAGRTGAVTLAVADVSGAAPSASPTLTTPTFAGITTADGANVTTASAMGALSIDVTKAFNTKSVAADSTFTFSGTPANTNQWFSMYVTNTDTNPHVLTFPSSFSLVTQAPRTTCPIPASGQLWMLWRHDGAYHVFGDGQYLNNFAATTDPGVGNDVTQGYGPGSLWGNATANTLWWCESNGSGAAVWNSAGSGVPYSGGVATLGTSGSVVGELDFNNATSGVQKIQPATGALGTQTLSLPNVGSGNTATLATQGSAINSQSTAYAFVLTDADKTVMHPAADTTARTWTIPANASVAFPVGTLIGIKNQLLAGVLTIAITTDVLTKVGAAGGTGSRTLAAGGECSILKVDSTHWEIVGTPELT